MEKLPYARQLVELLSGFEGDRYETLVICRERAEVEQQRQHKIITMADARQKPKMQQRDQLAAIDQRVQEHLAALKEAFVEFMASEIEPLRAENAALRQRCVDFFQNKTELLAMAAAARRMPSREAD